MRFRKLYLMLTVGVLAAGLLTGCGQQGQTPPEEDQTGRVESPLPSEKPLEPTEELLPADVPLEETPPAEPVTERELSRSMLEDWEEWLNEITVCELFYTPFESADEVKLGEMFYDGVDESSGHVTEEERAALEELRGTIHTDVTKVTTDEIISSFREVFGEELTRTEIARRMENWWHYLEKYDAYYHIHGDTMRLPITCTGGAVNLEDDSVRLTCRVDGKSYTVGLTALKESYIIDYIRLQEN